MTDKLKLLRTADEKEKDYYFNTLYPIDNDEFIAFTKRLIRDLLNHAKSI